MGFGFIWTTEVCRNITLLAVFRGLGLRISNRMKARSLSTFGALWLPHTSLEIVTKPLETSISAGKDWSLLMCGTVL